MDALVCWKCGAPLIDVPVPLSRRAECPKCRADLHVCKLCRFYAVGVAKQCREPVAEEIKDKERANFCDWFQARPDAYQPPNTAAADAARAQLEALFGGVAPSSAAEAAPPDTRTEAERARAALEKLFGKDDRRRS